jgi:hypothetical protein
MSSAQLENRNYYQRLLALCRGKENTKILPNLKRDEVLVLLSKAKIFFHPNTSIVTLRKRFLDVKSIFP